MGGSRRAPRMEPVRKVRMNGVLVDCADATVHVLSHALHYGTGVFEGIRCYETAQGPAVFRLREHFERRHRSAKIFLMDIPYSIEELVAATHELIRVNELESCYIRPIAYRGYGALRPGVRMTVSSWRRHDPNIIPPQAKLTGAYINSAMAKLEAVRS